MIGFLVFAALVAAGVTWFVVNDVKARVASAGALTAVSVLVFIAPPQPFAPAAPLNPRLDALRELDLEGVSGGARLAWLADAASQNPDDLGTQLAWGEALLQSGALAHAEHVLAGVARQAPSARAYLSWADAVVRQEEGRVSALASELAQAALDLDPENAWARSLLALEIAQAGDTTQAVEQWSGVLAELSDVDPAKTVIAANAAIALSQPRVSGDVVAAVAQAGPADPRDMIASVARRLADQPRDLAGWLVLARAKAVTEGAASGVEALAHARGVFADDPGALAILETAPAAWPRWIFEGQRTPLQGVELEVSP